MTNRTRVSVAAALAAISLSAAPLLAAPPQRENRGDRPSERSAQKDSGRSRAQQTPRVYAPSPAPERGPVQTGRAAPRVAAPRIDPRNDARQAQRYAPRFDTRARYGESVRSGRYYYGGRAPVVISPYPSYLFRPRLRLSIGLWVGYPIAYPYAYAGAYGVPYTPGAAYGAVSLAINPGDAGVYVDGSYVGVVGDFYETTHALTLAAGTHRIEVEAQGYRPMVFDVRIAPGQLIPYQGDLLPY